MNDIFLFILYFSVYFTAINFDWNSNMKEKKRNMLPNRYYSLRPPTCIFQRHFLQINVNIYIKFILLHLHSKQNVFSVYITISCLTNIFDNKYYLCIYIIHIHLLKGPIFAIDIKENYFLFVCFRAIIVDNFSFVKWLCWKSASDMSKHTSSITVFSVSFMEIMSVIWMTLNKQRARTTNGAIVPLLFKIMKYGIVHFSLHR